MLLLCGMWVYWISYVDVAALCCFVTCGCGGEVMLVLCGNVIVVDELCCCEACGRGE